jgi:hypothetical protein
MGKLLTKYAKQEDVPEKYLDLFEEKSGAWILTGVEGANDADAVARMGKQRDKERDRANAAEAKLKAFEKLGDRDIDELLKATEEVDDLKEQLEAATKGGKEGDAQLRQSLKDAKRKVTELESQLKGTTKERDEFKKSAEEYGGQIRRGTIEAQIRKAAEDAKIRPEVLADVLRAYRGDFEVGDDGKVTTREGGEFEPGASPEVWFSTMKEKKGHWWPDSVGGGGKGADGKVIPNGSNPFAKGQQNLTEASKLVKANPDKASQYARAAGFKDVDAAIDAIASASA